LHDLKKVLHAYGPDLESFAEPLDDRTTVTLRPTWAVALG
jgi:hypothetical protein